MSPFRYRQTGVRRVSFPAYRSAAEARGRVLRREAFRRLVHDLRNPINGILLATQLLEETGVPPDLLRIVQRLQRQANLLNDILERASADYRP
ncbi:histidine kinase dimerization/phospho-acceptor domain-containing protein [Mesoterricola sediminis]|uniref:histidine kinase n=1 Tax=Mesoterricola sediminis TaxID=2927980 RepID=A0AA48KDB2_9BACT|nr:histidine kinase dimerization/phospho-acceptor domain-containing protein [Mesoterricola sediminis]BDU76132.1 hypothetical protein METESE_10900 [Mesoterricola sediminis]